MMTILSVRVTIAVDFILQGLGEIIYQSLDRVYIPPSSCLCIQRLNSVSIRLHSYALKFYRAFDLILCDHIGFKLI